MDLSAWPKMCMRMNAGCASGTWVENKYAAVVAGVAGAGAERKTPAQRTRRVAPGPGLRWRSNPGHAA